MVSCSECIHTKLEYSNKMPDCVACGFVKALPENFEVLELIDLYGNFMFDGMSGIPNILFIKEILKGEGLIDRKDLLMKIMIYTAVACSQRNQPSDKQRVIKSKNDSKEYKYNG